MSAAPAAPTIRIRIDKNPSIVLSIITQTFLSVIPIHTSFPRKWESFSQRTVKQKDTTIVMYFWFGRSSLAELRSLYGLYFRAIGRSARCAQMFTPRIRVAATSAAGIVFEECTLPHDPGISPPAVADSLVQDY